MLLMIDINEMRRGKSEVKELNWYACIWNIIRLSALRSTSILFLFNGLA